MIFDRMEAQPAFERRQFGEPFQGQTGGPGQSARFAHSFGHGGNTPPQVGTSPWRGFARAFGVGGNTPPQVAHFNTGGPLPPMQTPGLPPMSTQTNPAQGGQWMMGGPGQSFMGPQSSLGRWFSAYRMGAYR